MRNRRRLMMQKKGGGIIDLSMVDNAGNSRSSMTTANCYMVHKAGTYCLPLVYGNAIKNGATNSSAYSTTSDTNKLATFVNHADAAITGPWITKSGSGIDAGMGITVTSAELLWQDATGLVTNIDLKDDYLYFKIGRFTPGNAVIAVKDNSGTIVWSWHIWVTSETYTNLTTVATGSHNYRVTPCNLGWVPTGYNGKRGYCPYYQWGRKDPFIPSTGTENTNKTVYNISNSEITGISHEESLTATIGTNIQNPTCHYNNSDTKGPVNVVYYNMWNTNSTATGNETTATVKTIYDPCPPGFCVPTSNLWYFFTNGNKRDSTYDSSIKGATWNIRITGDALWFPAAGKRSNSTTNLYEVLERGSYQTTTLKTTDYSHYMQFSGAYWFWLATFKSSAYSVRPVAEET